MPRLVHITTVSDSLIFIAGQVAHMKQRGFDVIAISSPDERLVEFGRREGISVHGLEMPRQITPFRDLRSVLRLTRLLRQLSPDVVHAHTPKGGLLGMIASRAARVPVRLYQMRGLPFVTARGWKRALLKTTERVSCTLATRVVAQSPSLREVAIAEGICPAGKIEVVGRGSNGVDSEGRFDPTCNDARANRVAVREKVGIPEQSVVIGFVGRLVRDKGLIELCTAWRQLRSAFPDTHLLVVGPWEPRDPVPQEIRTELESDPRVHLVGFQKDTERYYAAMDVLALPTYREGFPNVPLEAASMRLPVVATRIPGCVDAVADGVSGTLIAPGDARALQDALARYLADRNLRLLHGGAGRERVRTEFRREAIWSGIEELYSRVLGSSSVTGERGLRSAAR